MERYSGRGVDVHSTLDPSFDLAFSSPEFTLYDYLSSVRRPASHLLHWSWTGKDIFKCKMKEVWRPSQSGRLRFVGLCGRKEIRGRPGLGWQVNMNISQNKGMYSVAVHVNSK